MLSETEYETLDGVAMGELVKKAEVTPTELVELAITRAEKINPSLNAIIYPLYEKARNQAAAVNLAAGPLAGVPIVTKNLLGGAKGDPLTHGIQALKDLGATAEFSTYLIERFEKAGLVTIGRTNSPELGLMGTTEPLAYGPTHNPWNLDRSAGGSSGGSSAAVAARIVPIGHGGDGGGSLRIPASMCGIVGLKPSRGRLSFGPGAGDIWHGLANEGVMTISVRDMAAMMDIMAGAHTGDPFAAPPLVGGYVKALAEWDAKRPLRIGYMTSRPISGSVDPECVAAVNETVQVLRDMGHHVEEGYPSALDDPQWHDLYSSMLYAHTANSINETEAAIGRKLVPGQDVEAYTYDMAEKGWAMGVSQYLTNVNKLQLWSRQFAEWWDEGDFDLLMTPTLAEPPPLLGDMGGESDDPAGKWSRNLEVLPFTPACNISGLPATSLPLHQTASGLPVGVHFIARYSEEQTLLGIAAALEEAVPWKDRRPSIIA